MSEHQDKLRLQNEQALEQDSISDALRAERFRHRMDLAETMIHNEDGFYTLDPDPAALEVEHPFEPLEVQRKYEPELRRYFDFSIDYYPHFDRPLTVKLLSNWASFIDLHDEVVEQKFPVDRDIRAYISAFRLTLQRNYRRFILRRRRDQVMLLTTLMVPLLAWVLAPGLRPEEAPSAFSELLPFLTAAGPGRAMAIVTGLTFFSVFGILLYNLATSRQVLASTLHATAGDLKAKVQRRINSLHQGYNHCVKAVNEAELASNAHEDAWIDDAKYWAQLALWKPKRIEYIEKFYQSEMQRTRVHAFRWRVGMRLVGWIMVAFAVLSSLALGVSGGDPVSLTLAGLVAVLSFAHYQIILSKPYMVEITDIRRFIGENDWKRFSDINFDEDFADIVRRDKMRIRQEKSRGMGVMGKAA